MTEHCIIKADFSATRIVAGRKCLQLIFEVPIEQADETMAKLGGFPMPGSNRWCAVALLKPEMESTQESAANGHPKKSWADLARCQQAAILCSDEDFQRYFGVTTALDASVKLKEHFRISSRTVLDSDPEMGPRWDEFVALYRLHCERRP